MKNKSLALRIVEERLPKKSCSNCGATTGLVHRYEYIGGQGYVKVIECRDSVACWERWDAQNGI